MSLQVELPDGHKTVDIAFSPALEEPSDAKTRLIAMHSEGQDKLDALP